jgi:hypothetical protein
MLDNGERKLEVIYATAQPMSVSQLGPLSRNGRPTLLKQEKMCSGLQFRTSIRICFCSNLKDIMNIDLKERDDRKHLQPKGIKWKKGGWGRV